MTLKTPGKNPLSNTKITFLVDFDNTLINNDEVKNKIKKILTLRYGQDFTKKFIAIHDQVRQELGYVSFPVTIKKIAKQDLKLNKELHQVFHTFDFKGSLFNEAEKVINHLQKFGQVIVVTEGDSHYQTIKIKTSGIWDLVGGRVEIPLKDKVTHLLKFLKRYPSDIYYFIEDKPEVLKKVRDLYKGKIKTIHVCQGHYSPICEVGIFDITVKSLSELLDVKF